MLNRDTYEAADVVRYYSGLTELQKPEATILHDLEDMLRQSKMLDIGVGGGRTTHHFAGLVKEYVGIDYSTGMIESCERRLSSFPNSVSFLVCDVRDMSIFADQAFDFVLFSFNGIDYLSHTDRLRAFQEMRRVARKGGIVCLSSHNLLNLTRLPVPPRLTANPAKMYRHIASYCHYILRNLYFTRLRRARYAIVNDGAHESRLTTYYILPEEQLRQLERSGFTNIRVFSVENGKELLDRASINTARDPWLYYVCEVA
jgi:ubiquinone/menaquinone biosynthesis C-methylase UbiE